jgi:rhamnogalacturonyl hydrolase YesR
MITILQCEAYLATGDRRYIERASKEMVMYLDSLQRPNGLFYHATDVPFFWGRGNGWIAAGMSDLLRFLPENNPDKPKILACYKKMMAALLNFQNKNGTWNELIDEPLSWVETSGSGMIGYAMITGVKNGWLDKNIYGSAARKAWLGLVKYIDENAEMHEVCESTFRKNDKQYYLDRKRNIGDLHGQAPVLWCASALLR